MNENIEITLKKLSKIEPEQANLVASYLKTGSLDDLESLKAIKISGKFPNKQKSELNSILCNSDDYNNLIDQGDHWRLVHVLLALAPPYVWRWVRDKLWDEEDVDTFGLFWKNIQVLNIPMNDLLLSMRDLDDYIIRRGKQPTSLGRFTLQLNEDDLKTLAKTSDSRELLILILHHAEEKLPKILESLLEDTGCNYLAGFAITLLEHGGAACVSKVVDIYHRLESDLAKYRLVTLLAKQSEEFKPESIRVAKRAMMLDSSDFSYKTTLPAVYIARHCGIEVLDSLVGYVNSGGGQSNKVIEGFIQSVGIAAVPVIKAYVAKEPHSSYKAWIAVDKNNEYTDEIYNGISKEIKNRTRYWKECASVGVHWNLELVGPIIWPMLKDKSKVVRDEAIEILSCSSGFLEKGIELLSEGQAALRETGIAIVLLHKNDDVAISALRTHVVNEKSKKIRNVILEALGEDIPVEKPKELSQDEKIQQTLKKTKKPATPWIEGLSLSPFVCEDGSTLSDDHFKYLLAVQSKTKAFELAPELISFYHRLDREKNADAVFSLLEGFFGNGENVKEKWVLLIAGLLGDQRVVMALDKKISQWADKGRGKLSEYAVMAIALQGSEGALVAIDDAARRFATKYANIGAAAQVAFATAAETQGISVDELGDRVIPWLGFEPNQPRIVMAGDRTLHIHIGGPTLKFIYFDVDKNKVIKALPKSVDEDDKQSLKDDAALLRQVVKAQTKRLEALMIRQHRWPVDRWCELFLNHPILKAFGERLIWGHYNDDGILLNTYRVLEDGSLADVNEDEVAPITSGKMGLVHPLELDADQRSAWIEALEDYEIQSPFEQLNRPTFYRSDDDRTNKLYVQYAGTLVEGYAFKGRTEKRGWVKGYIGDGGGIHAIHKMFPALGIVATLRVDDYGAVIYDDVTIGELFFEHQSKDLWWGYDTPQSTDKRLISFGDVTDLAWSEVMADLAMISEAAIE